MNKFTESTIKQAAINWLKMSAIMWIQEEFVGEVARVESTRQVEGLFESLLSESFGG